MLLRHRVLSGGLPEAPSAEELVGLDDAERARAASFATPVLAARYVRSHLLLRATLAEATGLRPADLRFARAACPLCAGPHGRPVLLGHDGVHFSLSHAADVAVVAVAPTPVGVDVEPLAAPSVAEELAPRLHPLERAEIEAAGPPGSPARAEVFTRIWVRSEAYLKAIGTGLGRDPALDYLGLSATGPLPDGWRITEPELGSELGPELGAGHRVAVAVDGR